MGQAQQKHRAVLIVEDDAELRHLTAALFEDEAALFEDEKVDTIECESAEAALAVTDRRARGRHDLRGRSASRRHGRN